MLLFSQCLSNCHGIVKPNGSKALCKQFKRYILFSFVMYNQKMCLSQNNETLTFMTMHFLFQPTKNQLTIYIQV